MSKPKLKLEFLSGPLDGHVVILEAETQLTRSGTGPLICPWDTELGEPQAIFSPEGDCWYLEGSPSMHGTYVLTSSSQEQVAGKRALSIGDVIKASQEWLIVRG